MVSLVLNLTLLWKWILAIGIFDVLLNNAIVYYSTTAYQIQHISLLDSKKDLVPSSQYFDSMCLHFFLVASPKILWKCSYYMYNTIVHFSLPQERNNFLPIFFAIASASSFDKVWITRTNFLCYKRSRKLAQMLQFHASFKLSLRFPQNCSSFAKKSNKKPIVNTPFFGHLVNIFSY